MQPRADEETFRALARSSPWLWRTLRCTVTQQDRRRPDRAPVRAWLRRPHDLRAECDGQVCCVDGRPAGWSAVLTSDGRHAEPPGSEPPVRRPDGLVAWRDPLDVSEHDVPLTPWTGYEWVAYFDPRELADGRDEDPCAGDAPPPGTTVRDVRAITHRGRPALAAEVAPGDGYEPRCSCCALLFTDPVAERLRKELGDPRVADGRRLATNYLALLDVATGVLVSLTQLDGDQAGDGVEIAIEAVDEQMPDGLFRR